MTQFLVSRLYTMRRCAGVDGEIVALRRRSASPARARSRFSREPSVLLERAGLSGAAWVHRLLRQTSAKFDRAGNVSGLRGRGFSHFRLVNALWLKSKLHMRRTCVSVSQGSQHAACVHRHHESHAASAFFPSRSTGRHPDHHASANGARRRLASGGNKCGDQAASVPHSSVCCTRVHLLLRIQGQQWGIKLMGLAPYGQPIYRDLIFKHLLIAKPDGSSG